MNRADEANAKTLNSIKERAVAELSKLEEQINKAIADGKFSISNDGCLRWETKQKLEELGYKVKTGNQYNQLYYIISWD